MKGDSSLWVENRWVCLSPKNFIWIKLRLLRKKTLLWSWQKKMRLINILWLLFFLIFQFWSFQRFTENKLNTEISKRKKGKKLSMSADMLLASLQRGCIGVTWEQDQASTFSDRHLRLMSRHLACFQQYACWILVCYNTMLKALKK